MFWILDFIGYCALLFLVLATFALVFKLVMQANNNFDRAIALLASLIGFMLFWTAFSSGVPVSFIFLSALDPSGGAITNWLYWLVPPLIGGIGTYLFFSKIGKLTEENNNAVYAVILVLTWVAFAAATSFLSALSSDETVEHLLSNSTFVLGILFVIVFNQGVRVSLQSYLAGTPSEPEELKDPKTDWRSKLK